MGGIGLEKASKTQEIHSSDKNLTRNQTLSDMRHQDSSRLTWSDLKEQFPDADPISCVLDLIDSKKASLILEGESQLSLVAKKWPDLPSHVRQTILTLVSSANPSLTNSMSLNPEPASKDIEVLGKRVNARSRTS
ncbi:MAG: hypothetical protein ACON5J_02985 [Rubripirellula sp.]